MASEWEALAARCEAASGPDRELDIAIAKAAGSHPAECLYSPTASVDAILALIERELPGWGYMLRRHETARGMASCASLLAPPDGKAGDTWDVWAITTPLALASAFCRAMASRAIADQTKGGE